MRRKEHAGLYAARSVENVTPAVDEEDRNKGDFSVEQAPRAETQEKRVTANVGNTFRMASEGGSCERAGELQGSLGRGM
jgi:hypothetical protein